MHVYILHNNVQKSTETSAPSNVAKKCQPTISTRHAHPYSNEQSMQSRSFSASDAVPPEIGGCGGVGF